jgi:hypothetical protein
MFRQWPILWLLSVALSGCAVYEVPSEVPDQLEVVRSQAVAGKTSRKEVQALLGEAFLGDQRVEVYRVASGYDVTLAGPIIPLFWDTEEVILYALATYDTNDVVEDIDWGVYQHDTQSISANPTAWLRSTRLHAGEFDFAAFNKGHQFDHDREEMLLAPISESQNDLRTLPPPGMCVVFLFLGEPDDWRAQGELYIDGEFIIQMPLVDSVYWYWAHRGYWAAYYERIFTKTLIAQGDHEVSIRTSLKPYEFRRAFECKAGETFYAYPQLELIESEPRGFWGRKFEYAVEIKVDSQLSGSYEGWRRLLFYRGEWLGD